MTRRLNVLLAALFLLIALPGYWLLFDNTAPDTPPVSLHIGELRALAAAVPGKPPQRVEREIVVTRRIAQTYYAAGTGLAPTRASVMAFRLPDGDGHSIVINSGTRPGLNPGMFDAAAQVRIDAAVLRATKVLVTGVGPERTGGLSALADQGALRDNLWLTPAQINAVMLGSSARSANIAPRLRHTHISAVAPGVVVIPTPRTVNDLGALIYVRLANGREYLFCGDLAPLEASWSQLRLHSRLATPQTDRATRGRDHAWLSAIQRLKREAPDLVIVPGRSPQSLPDAPRFAVTGSSQ